MTMNGLPSVRCGGLLLLSLLLALTSSTVTVVVASAASSSSSSPNSSSSINNNNGVRIMNRLHRARGGGGQEQQEDQPQPPQTPIPTPIPTPTQTLPRPDFLAHVDRPAIERALATAKERHVRAVQQALRNYNTDAVVVEDTPSASAASESASASDATATTTTTTPRRLKEYTINAPGALPDFGNELARTVLVTDPEPFFAASECSRIVQLAEDYFTEHANADDGDADGAWTTQTSGQYAVAGFWIRDIPAVHEWFVNTVKRRLFVLLQEQYPDFITDVSDLCVDNAYLFKYTAETGRRTDVHTDSGCLSFTIALNAPSEYEGGGTWFEGLQPQNNNGDGSDSERDSSKDFTASTTSGGILEMDVGQVAIRPGGVKHCGNAIHSGVRYVIGGFCMHRNKVETVRQLLKTPDADSSTSSTSSSTSSSSDAAEQRANLEAAIVLNPECDAAYNFLANAYEQAGDKAAAQKVLEYCLRHVHPVSGEIAYSLGSLYMEQGRYSQVKECMETCLRADDCDVDAMMALAQAHAGLGDAAAEEACYQNIIRTPANGSNYNKVMASAYCNLGVLQEGEPEEVEYYQKALEYVPDNFEARYSLGSAYASRGKWQEAVASFREAIDGVGEDDKGNAGKALQSLYKVAMELIRNSSSPPASREEMMERFQDVMGVDNYDRLAVNAGAGAA